MKASLSLSLLVQILRPVGKLRAFVNTFFKRSMGNVKLTSQPGMGRVLCADAPKPFFKAAAAAHPESPPCFMGKTPRNLRQKAGQKRGNKAATKKAPRWDAQGLVLGRNQQL